MFRLVSINTMNLKQQDLPSSDDINTQTSARLSETWTPYRYLPYDVLWKISMSEVAHLLTFKWTDSMMSSVLLFVFVRVCSKVNMSTQCEFLQWYAIRKDFGKCFGFENCRNKKCFRRTVCFWSDVLKHHPHILNSTHLKDGLNTKMSVLEIESGSLASCTFNHEATLLPDKDQPQ